jgi:phosphatidylserine/phosphatidylglycerophosphate/cardiolipin synthase-like enzyme
LWNQGKGSMDAFLKAQSAALKVKVPWYVTNAKPKDMKESDVPIDTAAPKTTPPAIPGQIRRTVSGANSSDPFFTPIRQDVVEGYLLAIGLAEDFVYLENQYFRDERIGKAIIERHKKNSKLRAIIVIPSFSEELLRKTGDAVTKFGAALQFEIVDAVLSQMGTNVGVFAMERADKAVVYVHSKLLIVDDKFASIGSANANPRSLSMDTELDFVWYDQKSVSALRLQLWKEILGNPTGLGTWKTSDYVKKWKAIADANKTAKPAKLRGFVRPFTNTKFERGPLNLGPYS